MSLQRMFEDLCEPGSGILAESTIQTDDLMKSLGSLVKHNGGKWKSEKQAAYLYKSLMSHKSAVAERWGRRHIGDDPNAMAVVVFTMDSRFGRRDVSKIRYYGNLYVVDGGGVKAMVRADIKHPKGGGEMKILGPKGDTGFVRHGYAKVLYDHTGEVNAQAKKIDANRPMISKIEELPEYERNNFLQSIVQQLSRGYDLSLAQQRVLMKFMPVDDIDLSLEDPKSKLKEVLDYLERVIINPVIDQIAGVDMPSWANSLKREQIGELESWWKSYRKKPSNGTFDILDNGWEPQSMKLRRGWGFNFVSKAVYFIGLAARSKKMSSRTARELPIAFDVVKQIMSKKPLPVDQINYQAYWLSDMARGLVEAESMVASASGKYGPALRRAIESGSISQGRLREAMLKAIAELHGIGSMNGRNILWKTAVELGIDE